jgi:hypothetical protein
MLAKAGCYLDAPGQAGNTALHVAATAGNVDIVKILIAAGADTSVQNAYGYDVHLPFFFFLSFFLSFLPSHYTLYFPCSISMLFKYIYVFFFIKTAKLTTTSTCITYVYKVNHLSI